MKIDVFTFAYNEEEMMRLFCDYYSPRVRSITVRDHQSTDNTVEVASAYDNVEIIDWESDYTYLHDNRGLTEAKNNCWKDSDADWVIVCDVDEFLYPLEKLEKIEESVVRGTAYDLVSEQVPESVLDVDKLYRIHVYDKPLCFRPDKVEEVNYAYGSHGFEPEGDISVYKDEDMKLLHGKFLGRERFYKKYTEYDEITDKTIFGDESTIKMENMFNDRKRLAKSINYHG